MINCNLQLPPKKTYFSLYKLTLLQCLLTFAEYSLSAEYSAAFSCRIIAFGQNKKIRFRSITNTNPGPLSQKISSLSSYQLRHPLQLLEFAIKKRDDMKMDSRASQPRRIYYWVLIAFIYAIRRSINSVNDSKN
jgi:hypothetical protein